jgi:hypothetical protein
METVINYQISKSGYVSLKVYDMLGRVVATLSDELQQPGSKSVRFNAKNMPGGIYVYRLQVGTFNETKRLILLK